MKILLHALLKRVGVGVRRLYLGVSQLIAGRGRKHQPPAECGEECCSRQAPLHEHQGFEFVAVGYRKPVEGDEDEWDMAPFGPGLVDMLHDQSQNYWIMQLLKCGL